MWRSKRQARSFSVLHALPASEDSPKKSVETEMAPDLAIWKFDKALRSCSVFFRARFHRKSLNEIKARLNSSRIATAKDHAVAPALCALRTIAVLSDFDANKRRRVRLPDPAAIYIRALAAFMGVQKNGAASTVGTTFGCVGICPRGAAMVVQAISPTLIGYRKNVTRTNLFATSLTSSGSVPLNSIIALRIVIQPRPRFSINPTSNIACAITWLRARGMPPA